MAHAWMRRCVWTIVVGGFSHLIAHNAVKQIA
jgi:hypothetical protein